MSLKISAGVVALAAAISVVSSPLALAAPVHKKVVAAPTNLDCRYIGAISHRCYTFRSDATWREGLPDYHGSNGGG